MINGLPQVDRDRLRGIGFRAAVRHIATFFDPGRQAPVIVCGTENRPLMRLLKELGFDTCKHTGSSPIYRADLSDLHSYPPNVRKALAVIITMARHYKKSRRQTASKRNSRRRGA